MKLHRAWVLISCVAAVAWMGSCSSETEQQPPATGAGQGAAGAGTTGGAGGSGAVGASGTGGSAGAAAMGGAAGTGGGTGATGGAGGAGGGVSQVACDGSTCTAPDICCFNTSDQSASCMAPSQCQGSGMVRIACDGPEDCPGAEVCCHASGPPVVDCRSGCPPYMTLCHDGDLSDCGALQYCCDAMADTIKLCRSQPCN